MSKDGRDPAYGWDHTTRQSVQEFRKSAVRTSTSFSKTSTHTVTFEDTGGSIDGGSNSAASTSSFAAGSASSNSIDDSASRTRSIKEMEADQIDIDEDNPMKLYSGPLIDTVRLLYVENREIQD
jgi:hypothetical protein